MKKYFIPLILVMILLITGCDQGKKEEKKTKTPVMIYTAKPDSIASYVKLTGGLEAKTDLDLYSMSSEKIKKIYVNEGDNVKKGALLLEQQNAIILQGVKSAEAGLSSAQAQYDLAEREYQRMIQLFQKEAITQQQFDQAEMQFKAAKAGLDLSKAQLQQANEQLEYTRIYAPENGIIAMLYFREGQMVPAGVPVIKLVNNKKMLARLKLPEIDLSYVHLGQKAIANFSTWQGIDFNGEIISLDKAIDPVTRTLEIEIELNNGTDKLQSGMFGEFLLIVSESKNTIVLADQAIMTRTKLKIDKDGKQITEKEYYVFLEKDGKAFKQPIKTGIHSRGRIEITSGLNFNDNVIVVGQNIVKNGDEVKIVSN